MSNETFEEIEYNIETDAESERDMISYDPPLTNARWVRRNGLHIGIIWETPYGFQFSKWAALPFSSSYPTLKSVEDSIAIDTERQEAIVKSLQQKTVEDEEEDDD